MVYLYVTKDLELWRYNDLGLPPETWPLELAVGESPGTSGTSGTPDTAGGLPKTTGGPSKSIAHLVTLSTWQELCGQVEAATEPGSKKLPEDRAALLTARYSALLDAILALGGLEYLQRPELDPARHPTMQDMKMTLRLVQQVEEAAGRAGKAGGGMVWDAGQGWFVEESEVTEIEAAESEGINS